MAAPGARLSGSPHGPRQAGRPDQGRGLAGRGRADSGCSPNSSVACLGGMGCSPAGLRSSTGPMRSQPRDRLGRSLVRIAEAEQRAERDYRANVTVQMERDKVGVPKLSPEATSVLEAVHAAANGKHPDVSRDGAESRNRPAVAKVWEEGRRNPTIAAEIDQFKEAARQRLGEEGRGTALRSPQERLALSLPGAEPEHTQALRQVAHDLAAAQRGRTDYETQRTLEAFRQRESQHERTRHRHRPDLGR